ncbi:MAG: NnrS family protein [Methylococcales symbiont of Hymedesmia sp. n. MRB-2018]|nr:MAG: NnrS family protein [Methylococcales symbiont of Hymedesmia sp. n. MRB-2018]
MMNKRITDFPLFALGFRAFFALAGLFALVLIALWTSVFDGSLLMDNYYPRAIWHAHEMLLGYSVAVIAGFLLTAVQNWTDVETIKGAPLAGLCLLWVYGRLLPFYAELLPHPLIALVDFSFLPVLAYFVAKPIIQSGNIKNLFFVALLSMIALGNFFIHAEILGFSVESTGLGLDIVIAIIVMMILVIAGKVFPFFTEKGLPGVMAIRNPCMDKLAIGLSALVFSLLIFDVSGIVLTICAIVAVIANFVRVAGWYVQRIWYVPLLWVLYMGYAWIMLGFVFVALASVSLVSTSLATHAFTVGGIGVITLGMMARVSLGHTGRRLKASNTIAVAFALINLAAVSRVLLPAISATGFNTFLLISSYCWLAAFALFVFIYTPILSSVRIDGKKG